MRRLELLQPLDNWGTILDLAANPPPPEVFCCLVGRAATAKGIKYQISLLACDSEDTGEHLDRELVADPMLRRTMSYGGEISPHIGEIDTIWVDFIAIASIIPQLTATVSANRYWHPWSVEELGLTFGVIEQAIV